jgi:hypothetical protein
MSRLRPLPLQHASLFDNRNCPDSMVGTLQNMMLSLRKNSRTAALITSVLLAPLSAQAADQGTTAAARDLGYEGVTLFQNGDYAAASEKLERAFAVLKAPTLGLWSARALAKQGKLLSASERYLEITRLEPAGEVAVQKQAQADAVVERNELVPRIPALVINVEGAAPAEVELTLDGAAVPSALIGARRPVDPGKHELTARSKSGDAVASVSVAEGETKQVALKLAPTGTSSSADAAAGLRQEPAAPDARPAKPGSVQRTMGWVSIGVGGAALAVGGVTGAMAIGKKSALSDDCRDNQCPPPVHGEVDSYNSLRTVSTVAFAAGAVVGAAGVVLLLTAPSSSDTGLRARAYIGLGTVGIHGVFQ